MFACLLLLGACATTSSRSKRRAVTASSTVMARIEAVEARVERASVEFDLPLDLLMAVIWVESRFDPEAVSSADAHGLMQLLPGTAADMARKLGLDPDDIDLHDPTFNIRAGAAYIRLMLDRFGNQQNTALAAYYSGPGRVRRALRRLGRPPHAGLRYAAKVQAARRRFRLYRSVASLHEPVACDPTDHTWANSTLRPL